MKKWTLCFVLAAILLPTVYIVEAQATFQLTAQDCKDIVKEIRRGDPLEVMKIINEGYATEAMRDDITARTWRVVYMERMEAKLDYTTKRTALQKAIEDGDITISIDGTMVIVGTVTTDGKKIQITSPIEPE